MIAPVFVFLFFLSPRSEPQGPDNLRCSPSVNTVAVVLPGVKIFSTRAVLTFQGFLRSTLFSPDSYSVIIAYRRGNDIRIFTYRIHPKYNIYSSDVSNIEFYKDLF